MSETTEKYKNCFLKKLKRRFLATGSRSLCVCCHCAVTWPTAACVKAHVYHSSTLPVPHAAALLIRRSRAPGSCETLSAFFPTLASANRRRDSPIGRGAERWLDNTPAGRQSRAAQSALQGQTTKRSKSSSSNISSSSSSREQGCEVIRRRWRVDVCF